MTKVSCGGKAFECAGELLHSHRPWPGIAYEGAGASILRGAKPPQDDPSKRKISVQAPMGRRIHEDLEAQMARRPAARLRLQIQNANTFNERSEAAWIETPGPVIGEKHSMLHGGKASLEEAYEMAIELMDEDALLEADNEWNPESKASLAVHKCRAFLNQALDAHSSIRAQGR